MSGGRDCDAWALPLQAISLWDVDGGMPQIDKYTYSEDPNIVAGSCLGFGLCCCCVRSELDPAFALLSEHVHATSPQVRVAAVMALGLAYAGTGKEDVRELLLPLISPEEASVELVAHAALALGVVFAGTKDGAFFARPQSGRVAVPLAGAPVLHSAPAACLVHAAGVAPQPTCCQQNTLRLHACLVLQKRKAQLQRVTSHVYDRSYQAKRLASCVHPSNLTVNECKLVHEFLGLHG